MMNCRRRQATDPQKSKKLSTVVFSFFVDGSSGSGIGSGRKITASTSLVGTHCVIHREVLVSRTSSAAINNKLAIAIRINNFVKKSFVKSRLFTILYKDMDADHETLLFYSALQWLSKGNMLAWIYNQR